MSVSVSLSLLPLLLFRLRRRQLHTIDKIQARLGHFVRVRRTLLQRAMRALPRSLNQRRWQQQQQQQQHNQQQQRRKERDEVGRSGLEIPEWRPEPQAQTRVPSSERVSEAAAAVAGTVAAGASNALRRVGTLGMRRQRMGSPSSATPRVPPGGGGGEDVPATRASDEAGLTAKAAATATADGDGVGVGNGDVDARKRKLAVEDKSAIEGSVSVVADGSTGHGTRTATDSAKDLRRTGSASCSTGEPRDEGEGGPDCGTRKVTRHPITDVDSTDRAGTTGVSGSKVLRRVASRLNTAASARDPRKVANSPVPPFPSNTTGDQGGGGGECPRGTIELHMVSFGAPRVGNTIYAARYNDVVPHSFRVVVDGDPVPVSRMPSIKIRTYPGRSPEAWVASAAATCVANFPSPRRPSFPNPNKTTRLMYPPPPLAILHGLPAFPPPALRDLLLRQTCVQNCGRVYPAGGTRT